uniref:Secreted protein n=1 Tax=Globodera pallida TaxID=36090 RepID=A0A183CB12_GLOPA
MKAFSALLLILAYFLATFEFGAFQSLEEWQTVCQETINGLGQEAIIADKNMNMSNELGLDLNALKVKLEELEQKLRQFPKSSQSAVNQKYLKIGTVLAAHGANVKYQGHHLQKSNDQSAVNIGENSANDKYLQNLMSKIRTIVLGFQKDFDTLIIEVQLEQNEQEKWEQYKLPILLKRVDKMQQFLEQNSVYCAKEPFEHAAASLNAVLQANAIIQKDKVKRILNQLVVETKLSILENEFDEKITRFSDPCIDADGYMAFAHEYYLNRMDISLRVGLWPHSAEKKNICDKLNMLASKTMETTEPLKQTITEKLQGMLNKSSREIEALKSELFKSLCKIGHKNAAAAQQKLASVKERVKQVYANCLTDMHKEVGFKLAMYRPAAANQLLLENSEPFDGSADELYKIIENKLQQLMETFTQLTNIGATEEK